MSEIKRVVLHKHGMAYFERESAVTGDATLELGFRHDEMDDVLKSLAFSDSGGGKLASIAYDPHPRLSERLDDIRVSLPQGGGVVALIGQIIGAEVTLHMDGDELSGRVLGIENVEEAHEKTAIRTEYLSLMSDGDVRRVKVKDIEYLTPVDEGLRRDLGKLLEQMDAGRRSERRRVSLDLRGDNERKVFVSYVVPATVWKTSYRVLFDDEDKPRVLGFALVDNDSQDDWKDVELSLVSGLPISFTHDLYSPRRRARPHVRVETEAPIAPPVLEGATYDLPQEEFREEAAEYDDMIPQEAGAPPAGPARMRSQMKKQAAPAPSGAPAPMDRSVDVSTRTQDLGDKFAYNVSTPVSIKSGHSALVPILNEALEGEVVAVYNRNVREGNPLTSFRLKNTSKLTLEGGPATVVRHNEYAGEAMLDTMRPDEEKLVPFSVELGCNVTTSFDSRTEDKQEIRAARGYVYQTTWRQQLTTYTIKNTTRRKLKIFLDHPANRAAEYVDTPEPKERTDTFDRFVLEVSAGKQLSFKVTEREKSTTTMTISPQQVAQYFRLAQSVGNKELANELGQLVEAAKRIFDAEHELQKIEDEAEKITEQHERIRDNLANLSDDNKKERDLRGRYVGILDADETKIEKLNERREVLEKLIDDLRQEFDNAARDVKVE